MTDTVTVTLTLPVDSATRKDIPIRSGCIDYFPAAIAGVAMHSVMGNNKHNPGEPLHHARGKSMDHADCIDRHLTDIHDIEAWIERACGDEFQPPAEVVAMLLAEANANSWRALALSQELHERYGGAPLAPRARLPEPKLEPLGAGPLEPEGFPDGYSITVTDPTPEGQARRESPKVELMVPTHVALVEPNAQTEAMGTMLAAPLTLACGCVKRCKGHAVTEAAAAVDVVPTGPKDPSGRPYATKTEDAEFPQPPPVHRPVEAAREFDPAD